MREGEKGGGEGRGRREGEKGGGDEGRRRMEGEKVCSKHAEMIC